jgi:hypothetical protein
MITRLLIQTTSRQFWEQGQIYLIEENKFFAKLLQRAKDLLFVEQARIFSFKVICSVAGRKEEQKLRPGLSL